MNEMMKNKFMRIKKFMAVVLSVCIAAGMGNLGIPLVEGSAGYAADSGHNMNSGYMASTVSPGNVSYGYKANEDVSLKISLNGNTFISLEDKNGELDTESYTVDSAGKLTIKKEYLDTLQSGKNTFTVWLYAGGVESDDTKISTTFNINVLMRKLTVTGVRAADRGYDGTDKVDILEVFLDGVAAGEDVSVDLRWFRGSVDSPEIGNYETLTLPGCMITGEDSDNYYIQQPDGAVPIINGVSITKGTAVINVQKSYYEKTFGDAPFVPEITGSNVEKDVVYTVSEGKDVVAVSGDAIRILKPGSATVSVDLPESEHYYAAESKSFTVDVAKKDAPATQTVERRYLSYKGEKYTLDLKTLLPEDYGSVISYFSLKTSGPVVFAEAPAVDKNGILSFAPDKDSIDGTKTVTLSVSTQNYTTINLTINLLITNKYPVTVKAGTTVDVKNSLITYGEKLSQVSFEEAVFTDENGKAVKGTLSWKKPDEVLTVGDHNPEWIFTPENEDYAEVSGNVAVTVNKAKPVVESLPQTEERTYHPSLFLQDEDIKGGVVTGADGKAIDGKWRWVKTDTVPTVQNEGYEAVFTPKDTWNYETVTEKIAVSVTKAVPYIKTAPYASAVTYGDSLEKSELIGGKAQYSETDSMVIAGSFSWETSTIKPAGSDSNITAYAVIFTPEDEANYDKTRAEVTLTVNGAESVLGDVNADESVDAVDALEILKSVVRITELSEDQKLIADVNRDSVVDARDALRILKYIAGMTSLG